MYNYRPIGIYASKAMADEEREEKTNKNLPNEGEKTVIDIYFSKPEIDDLVDVPVGQPKQKKRFPEIYKARLGDEIFLVARTENLIGKKLKIEVRQAKEKQLVDKDQPIIFKNQDKNGSIIITVGKGTKDKDGNGQDYFAKYANANKLENFAWKSFLLRPESDSEFEQWKKTIENTRDKKLYLYFHAEVLDAQNEDVKYLNTDKSEGENNFANSTGQYFEINSSNQIISLQEIEALYGANANSRKFREEVVYYFNQFAGEPIHLNTPLRKAHFFAQVGAETLGIDKNWIVEGDAGYYSVNGAKGLFGERARNLEKKGLLVSYCAQRPAQVKLFNYIYAAENGYGNGNEASGDGYKYRGRGLKQTTGKGNYEDASDVIKEFFPQEYIDLVKFPDKAREPKYAVLSALAFWEKHTIWKTADTIKVSTNDNIKKIRKRVNPGLAGWENCKKYFEKGLKVFKVE